MNTQATPRQKTTPKKAYTKQVSFPCNSVSSIKFLLPVKYRNGSILLRMIQSFQETFNSKWQITSTNFSGGLKFSFEKFDCLTNLQTVYSKKKSGLCLS